MVTDEERDYMYRSYALEQTARINFGIRRRLAPLLQNHRLRIHLMNGLLFSFPGTPIIYYGDEIGMGDNIYLGDRNGVRTPMQWSADRNAGFSRANPQRLYLPVIIDPQYHYEQVNVEAQQSNPYSLLWWVKRLIAQRKRFRAFGRGTMEFVHTENRKILAFIRRYEEETILVVANLSRYVQCFDLDLAQYRGMVPVELSGSTRFPEIGERPYLLNLGPFAFYWFALERQRAESALTEDVPLIAARTWEEVLANRDALARAIVRYVRSRRWFAGKARTITSLAVRDTVPLPGDAGYLALIDIEYADAEPDVYLLPLGMTQARRAAEEGARSPTLIARLREGCLLYEPVGDPKFAAALLDTIGRRRQLAGERGTVTGAPSRAFRELRTDGELPSQLLKTEQSNTAIIYDETLFLKLFRRIESGVNTDLEMTQFFNETSFAATPRVAGSLEYRVDGGEPSTLAILQSYIPSSGDAWTYTLDAIARFFEDVVSGAEATEELEPETVGTYLADAETLGRRTAEMHLALASRDDIPSFAPEPFTPHYQRSIYQSMRTQAVKTMQLLRRRANGIEEAEALLAREPEVQQRIRRVLEGRITGLRIRTHGDFHLGQVLRTGNDFAIIDFEGEPSRSLSERRIKRSALRDVAGMLRSFHYAPYAVVHGQSQGSVIRSEDIVALESGASFWHHSVSAAFLRAYLETSGDAAHLPRTSQEQRILLDAYLLEKALYEIVYELNNRPEWVRIPLRGVLELLDAPISNS
jgi:maltose alpha-D-glucosyltransferase/alpha-amylase